MNGAFLCLPSWEDKGGTAHSPQHYLIPHATFTLLLFSHKGVCSSALPRTVKTLLYLNVSRLISQALNGPKPFSFRARNLTE